MSLSLLDMRSNAIYFSREWKGETSEEAEAKSFWDGFFKIFGITRRRIASFEKPVKRSDNKGGFIDLLWKGVLLVEHKSRGLDLDRAFHQATDYFHGLKERDLPRYIIVSDFARIRLYDLESDGAPVEFPLEELHKNIRSFLFIVGLQPKSYPPQDPVNVKAAAKLGDLHDRLKTAGYAGHQLELLLVRVLFCLFAEKNQIFEVQQFREWIEQRTSDDGSDLGPLLAHLFQTLNEPEESRPRNLDEQLAAFRYINGRLFEENIPLAAMDRKMREIILECTTLDWSRISPAIFGALFQSIMDKKARRSLGAHYTSETNILKALQPLFLDSLRAEFARIRRDSFRLKAFHDRLGKIRILDPACGCGNFLVIAYREIRLLELEVLKTLFPEPREGRLDISNIVFVDVDQLYGIEIEEFPAQIAQVALWMTDHQMNQLVSAEFGQYFARLPLKKAPNIVHGNALQRDWREIVDPSKLSYIVGNPPFKGKKEQTKREKAELLSIFHNAKGAAKLDYVSCWYRKATDYMTENRAIRTSLVSTNSITQGEQPGALWPGLLKAGVVINFAHRTFQWSSEARRKAAVHCIIIGFGLESDSSKWLFTYETLKSDPHPIQVGRINPYLVDGPDVVLKSSRKSLCSVPPLNFGSMPNDGGNLLLTRRDLDNALALDPGLGQFVRPFLGSDEFINGAPRYCFWLSGTPPQLLREHPELMRRIENVRKLRVKSTREETTHLAATAMLFGEDRQPESRYLAIPKTSSETRYYIPISFLEADVIASTELFTSQDAANYEFGVLTSLMHMAWVRAVCGRLKSDYRYSAGIVYNNFPWPEHTEKHRASIEAAAQAVLDERARHTDATLADLYKPLAMPPGLVKAHRALDRAVDVAYGKTNFGSEAERVAFLFSLYEKLTSLFSSEPKGSIRRQRRRVPHP